ncbi:hypothetical protein ANN_25837 [Periplaneta americana]|uniref:Reverse transcriptase domain-containing protein n=1 Tax=Periplaneta americana TaxID=6978 RepID=A0ABQ8S498_PERAM|nr:hypothetical protein ANN_25837 [Periplaneta americana]
MLDWTWSFWDWIILFALLLVLLYRIYRLGTHKHNHFSKQDVPFIKPLPFVGNMGPTITRKLFFPQLIIKYYNELKDHQYGGIFFFQRPALLIRDPELIKTITIKDFDSFTDHMPMFSDLSDPIWSRGVNNLKGQRWKEMRATLSPAFTSSKMKTMFVLVSECCQQFVQYLEENSQHPDHDGYKIEQDGDTLILELKDFYTRYANDVIATTAFGIGVDSLKQPTNEFYMLGQDITYLGGLRVFKWIFFVMMPKFAQRQCSDRKTFVRLHYRLCEYGKFNSPGLGRGRPRSTTPEVQEEILEAVNMTPSISTRRIALQVNVPYTTVWRLLKEYQFRTARRYLDRRFPDRWIGQLNIDVRSVFKQEVDILNIFCNDNDLRKEKRSETLRLYPPVIAMDRSCVKSYTLPADPPLEMKPGDGIWIPVYALHRDPEYFPDPERFDPERFSDENKHNIRPFTYFPFGAGPRICIDRKQLCSIQFFIKRSPDLHRIRRQWQRERQPWQRKKLNYLIRLVKINLEQHRLQSYQSYLSSLSEADNTLWYATKRILREPTVIPTLRLDSQVATDTESKCNLLASHYQHVFTPNENKNEQTTSEFEELIENINKPTVPENISYTTPQELSHFIQRLPNKKYPGHDLISNIVLKKLTNKALTYFTIILNAALLIGYFPRAWKLAEIIVFHKPNKPKQLPSSYRPISILPTLSRLFEKVIHHRICKFTFQNKIIPDFQFGFRPKHSTTHQLKRVTESIIKGFEEKQYTATLFLDIAQVFDTVWYDGLMLKLCRIGFPDYLTRIVKSFLSERQFSVRIDGIKSTLRPVLAGVPQGSILSPLLFNIFTYDIPCLQPSHIAMYADDTVLFYSHSNLNTAISTLQTSLQELSKWFSDWRLLLNITKTEAKIFSLRPIHNPPSLVLLNQTWASVVHVARSRTQLRDLPPSTPLAVRHTWVPVRPVEVLAVSGGLQ